jgi:hypothetical protein
MLSHTRRFHYLLLLLACMLQSCGCGTGAPPLYEVSGRVTFGGRGLTAGSISFHPAAGNSFQSDSPSSQLQLDGSFRMKTFPWGFGVPQGVYEVTVSPELAQRIGRPEYGDRATSPLRITVPAASVTGHEFRLD